MMNRRGFITSLLTLAAAPVVTALAISKPKPYYFIGHDQASPYGDFGAVVAVRETWSRDENGQYTISMKTVSGTEFYKGPSPYWRGQKPFVQLSSDGPWFDPTTGITSGYGPGGDTARIEFNKAGGE